jgi:RimJ/RimL family protein N-acetyltransferase
MTPKRTDVVWGTFSEANASARVLTKCGFRPIGEVIDPEDGPVWRWEKQNGTVS